MADYKITTSDNKTHLVVGDTDLTSGDIIKYWTSYEGWQQWKVTTIATHRITLIKANKHGEFSNIWGAWCTEPEEFATLIASGLPSVIKAA